MNRCNGVNSEESRGNFAAIFSRDALICSGVKSYEENGNEIKRILLVWTENRGHRLTRSCDGQRIERS